MATAVASVALRVDTALAIPGLLALPPPVLLILAAARPTRRRQRDLFAAESSVVARTAKAIDGAGVLRVYGTLGPVCQSVDEGMMRSEQGAVAAETSSAAAGPMVELAGALGIPLVFAFAWSSRGTVDLASTATVLAAALLLMYRPLHGLAQTVFGFGSGLASADRPDELLRLPTEQAGSGPPRTKPFASLRLDGLDFDYDGRPVLVSASAWFRAGELVAITGESGAGKSSLIGVLAGLLPAPVGSISIDVVAASRDSLIAATAWMPQNPALFHDSILNNVALGAPHPRRDEAIEVCRRVGARDFIASLPQGYDAVLHEGGSDLSTGQRQRITLARALEARPSLASGRAELCARRRAGAQRDRRLQGTCRRGRTGSRRDASRGFPSSCRPRARAAGRNGDRVGTTNRRRAIALATLLSIATLPKNAEAEPDRAAIADAVRQLDGDHDPAMAAVYVLQSGGERAAKQIHATWPTISLLGQKRVIGALVRLGREHDAAIDVLIEAARSDDEDLRDRAFEALRQSEARGRRALVELLVDPELGDRAASLLARAEPAFAIRPLLDAMARPAGPNRPALRASLGTAVQRFGGDANGALREWLASSPPVSAVASASVALIGLEAQRAPLTAFIEYAAPRSTDFPSAWRLLQSAGAAGPSVTIDRWVRSQLDEPKAWMLRQSAVNAISARGHRENARASLADPYPRVRASAATALSGDHQSVLERATLARRDVWPMVRAAAVSSLRTEGEALAVVVASVDDSMSEVRAAAIEVLSASSRDEGWDRIHRRLRARDEWPSVTKAAIEYVVAHCRTDAAEALFALVMRAAPSNARTEDLNNAARAIEALRALGSPEAVATIEALRTTRDIPPTLKMALEQPLAKGGGCRRAAP